MSTLICRLVPGEHTIFEYGLVVLLLDDECHVVVYTEDDGLGAGVSDAGIVEHLGIVKRYFASNYKDVVSGKR